MEADTRVGEVEELTSRIVELLDGFSFTVQATVLSDLTAVWLASIDGENKRDVRNRMMANFLKQVLHLVPINEAEKKAAAGKRKEYRRH